MTEAARTLADLTGEIDSRIQGKTACRITAPEWTKLSALIADLIATRSPLPGTREEVAQIVRDQLIVHSRPYGAGWAAIDLGYGITKFTTACADAILTALPPAPMPEREGIKSVENEIARKIDQLDEYIAKHCQGDNPAKVHARTIAEGRKLQANMDLILVSRALASHDDKEG